MKIFWYKQNGIYKFNNEQDFYIKIVNLNYKDAGISKAVVIKVDKYFADTVKFNFKVGHVGTDWLWERFKKIDNYESTL